MCSDNYIVIYKCMALPVQTQACYVLLSFCLKCILPNWRKTLGRSTHLPNDPYIQLFTYLSSYISNLNFLKPPMLRCEM